jgi:hypothetical protein
MKIIRCGILALLIAFNAAGADTAALSLKVIALDPTAKSGSKITIEVTATNESSHEITYHNTSVVCDYSLTVLTSSSAPAPETSFKKQHRCVLGDGLRMTGRNIVVTLKPGESNSEQVAVTEQYDMTAPGEYSVQVERTFPEVGHFRSNTVIVKVTQ